MQQYMRWLRAAVFLLFIVSGATSLMLEVVWTRICGTFFGNTIYATSIVLTVFMLGLALGSVVWGRIADRFRQPLFLYGCLEIGVGAYAFLFPVLADVCCAFHIWFYRAAGPGELLLTTVRFALCVLLLLPPTFLMGGTLPVLSRHLGAEHHDPGKDVGYLYGANTFGAVVGCLLAGFVFLQILGVRGTLFAAGGAAMISGLLAAAAGWQRLAPTQRDLRQPKPQPGKTNFSAGNTRGGARSAREIQPLSGPAFRLVLAAFAMSGFCALAYEVLWSRVLIFVVSTSTYSFAAMLATFLTGMAVGSFISARFLVRRLRQPVLWFGIIEVLVGLSVLISVPVLAALDKIDFRIAQWIIWDAAWQVVLVWFLDVCLVLLLPALLLGAAFPIVTVSCLRGSEPIGRCVGQLYAANTVGCVLGSFTAGFVLLPRLGTQRSLLALVALNLLVGVALIWQAAGRSVRLRWAVAAFAAAMALAAFVVTPAEIFYQTFNTSHNPSTIVFLEEHPSGTVSVHDLPDGERLLAVSGVDVAGTGFMLRSTQKLQGYIPLCLHPHPRRVVQIGFGSGETTRVGLDFGVEDYTVVEICPAVFDAGRLFEDVNRGSYRDPRVHKIIMDGKNFAMLSDEHFDVIMNDSVSPGACGGSALYTVDHFRHCREHLADGGLFSCWIPLDLRPSELCMVLRSFQEVFPHTSLWVASNCLNKHALILGSLSPLSIDFARLDAVVSRSEVAADLKTIAINDVYDLLDCHMCDEDAVRELVRGDPLNSDDRPRLEISCAVRRSPKKCWKLVMTMLVQCHSPIAPHVTNYRRPDKDRAALARRFEATGHLFLGQIAQVSGDAATRARQFDLANQANPGDARVRSCQEEFIRGIRDLYAAVKASPSNPVLAQRLADQLLMGQQYEEAGAIYAQLVELQPPLGPRPLIRLAEIRCHFGQTGAALKILDRCLSLFPDCAEAHDCLASIHREAGELDLARQHSNEAIRLAPDDPLYQLHRRQLLDAIEGRPAVPGI
ncbi:MAG: fused MFS/spermidine synthase [Thermoguttaceae bacterium]